MTHIGKVAEMADIAEFTRANSYSQGIGLANERHAQAIGPALPEDTIVVSADGHLALSEDIWHERVPDRLKDKVPRIWFDAEAGIFQLGMGGKSFYPIEAHPLIRSIEGRESTGNIEMRIKDLDDEGIAKEVIFPQTLALFFRYPDFELREWIFRGYNEYLGEVQQRFAGRLYPVPIAHFWKHDDPSAWVREIADLGLKTIMLPMKPGETPDGDEIYYGSPAFDPVWSAIEEVGLPVCFHIGETIQPKGPAALVCEGMFQMGGGGGMFRKIWAELVFSGVFDRHPKLQIMFAEGGISWVPSCLQDAEMLFDSYNPLLEYVPRERPSHYWHRHCQATFMNDAIGLSHIEVIGAERALWSSDYPHNESTFGYSRDSMERVVQSIGEKDARRVLGGNAINLFDLA